MTPVTNVTQESSPPNKTQRHIELETKEVKTDSEMDEYIGELQSFHKRWEQKRADEQVSHRENMLVIIDRLKNFIAGALLIFIFVMKVRSFWDFLVVYGFLSLFVIVFKVTNLGVLVLLLVMPAFIMLFKLKR